MSLDDVKKIMSIVDKYGQCCVLEHVDPRENGSIKKHEELINELMKHVK